MKLTIRIIVVGLLASVALGFAAQSASAAEVYREKCVSSGDRRTLETFWNTTVTGWFQGPAGAQIRVRYAAGWFGVNRQTQTLDGINLKRLDIGAWSKVVARMQIKVPQSGCITYRLAFEGP